MQFTAIVMSTSPPVQAGLAYLVATFRADVDSWQVRAYTKALAGIDAETVMAAAEHLVNQAAAGRKFFPLPTAPDWKAACAAVIETQRRAAFQQGVANCTHPSFMESYQDAEGVEWTRRCDCYRRGKQLMAAVHAPLALPMWTDPEKDS